MNKLDDSVILNWWNNLIKEDRGGRAELRRAHDPTEVVFLPAYHRLYVMLDSPNINKEALACLAGLCAHIKENREGEFAKQMAECPQGSKKSKISSLRFRRFLSVNDREELYLSMIRIIRQLGGKVDVIDLAKTVYWWNEKTKKDLAYKYYANARTEK